MLSNFERSLRLVLNSEGGYVNHPKDPGGPTNQGVTQAVYDAHRRLIGVATRPVQAITQAEVQAIYKARYWDLCQADRLPFGVDYFVFDGAVNSGVGQSVKWLQRALGAAYTGPVDGLIGPATLAAVAAYCKQTSGPAHLILSMADQRMAFLKALKTWPTFGRGWTARVSAVKKSALGMLDATSPIVAPLPAVSSAPSAKAIASDVVSSPSPAGGDLAAGAGGVAAAIATAISQLSAFQSIPNVSTIVAVLAVSGVAVAIVGGLWRWYASRRRRALMEAVQ